MTADSPDLLVTPTSLGRAPLQGAGVASVKADEVIGLEVVGENVLLYSVRFWVQNVDTVAVSLYSEPGVYPAADVCIFLYL